MKFLRRLLIWAALLVTQVRPFVFSPGSKRRCGCHQNALLKEEIQPQQHVDELKSPGSSCPMLELVPSVPILGSFFPPLTGVPSLNRTFPIRFNVLMNKKYGDFYRMGVPTFGKDIQPDLYVLTDPAEMQKVVQSQPDMDEAATIPPKYQYPVGVVEQQWPLFEYLQQQNTTMAYIFSRGPDWWQARQALQSGLVNPPRQSIVKGAIRASRRISDDLAINNKIDGADGWQALRSDHFVHQLHRASFDLLEQLLFHESAFSSTSVDDDGLSDRLFEATLQGMLQAQVLRRSPWQNLMRALGLETRAMRTCHENLEQATSIIRQRVENLLEQSKGEEGQHNQNNSNLQHRSAYTSYIMRQVNSTMSVDDLPFACLTLLLGGIDTTAGKISWNILQLALHPPIQESLHKELTAVDGDCVRMNRTTISQNVLDRARTPWLHGVIRETHRLTPALTHNVIKDTLASNVSIHNRTFERQSAFLLDSTSPQLNSKLFKDDDPYTYNPTRWFREAVRARQGTDAQLLDHPYLSQPFGQGQRRCPGAALASAEVHAFIAQFVMDFQVDIACQDEKVDAIDYRDIPSRMNTGPVPIFPDRMRIRRRQPQH